MKRLLTTVVLIGLAAYLAAFFATPMRSFPSNAGEPPSRAKLFGVLLLCPDSMLFPYWFGVPAQFKLADRVPVLLAAAAILAWAALVGWLLLKACRADRGLTRLETSIFATVVGLNVLSTWTLLMGLLGQLGRTHLITFPALLTLAVAAICYWRRRSTSNGSNSRGLTAPGAPPPTHDADAEIITPRWLWLGLPFVLAILLAAMLPPMDFDVCEYHLQAPKEFLQQGRITFLPHNVYANMPLGAEMLSLLGMVLAGDWWWGALVGKTVTAAFTPLCALGVFAAGRRLYSTGAGVVASLAYVSIPWIVGVSSSGLVEGVSACYLFLALYAVVLSNESQKTANPAANGLHPTALVILAGYLAGGAVAAKYPAVLFVVAPLSVWTFVAQFKRIRSSGSSGERRERASPQVAPHEFTILSPGDSSSIAIGAAFRTTAIFLLAATLGCGLWLGKNWAFTGNPTYPLLYGVFDGKTWDADKDSRWNQAHRAHEFSPELFAESFSHVAMTSELLSPLVLPLAILAFFTAAASRRLRWSLLAYALFYFAAWWLLTHRIDRFWLPVLPVLALLAGAGAFWSTDLRWRRTLAALLLIGLTWNFLLSTCGVANAWFVPLEQLRIDTSAWIKPWHYYLNNDSARGTVLTVGDAAVFDLQAPVLYSTCFDDCVFEQLVKGKTAAEIRAAFAARNIAYVFVNWDEIARYRDTYGFTDFVQPEVFDRLVEQGIFEPIRPSAELPGQLYRVKTEK